MRVRSFFARANAFERPKMAPLFYGGPVKVFLVVVLHYIKHAKAFENCNELGKASEKLKTA